jgi:hypothetical protein
MKRTTLAAACGMLLLAGCGAPRAGNPLLQIQHDEQLADALASIIINKDPLADDAAMRAELEKQIAAAKNSLSAVQSATKDAAQGPFIPAKADVRGWMLYQDDMLYLSSDFESDPGLDLHLYLTTVVDPRDVSFPVITAVDLGRIDFPYVAMALPVPHRNDAEKLRSGVLWDNTLKRLYGFVQLSQRQ